MSGLRRFFAGLAGDAAVPVFPAVGAGARDRVEALALERRVRLVRSPRHAAILLVAGDIPEHFAEYLSRVHDQLAHPRATLLWGSGAPVIPNGDTIPGDEDPVERIIALHRALLHGDRASDEDLLPDEPPAPWRGVGEHGQGGKGMMGGTPYGRPMAMTGADIRDGLALDRLEIAPGPFFPPFPPGLVLELVLQGDVVQAAKVIHSPFEQPLPRAVRRVLSEPVATADVEDARARLLLRRAARVLRVGGADAVADRALSVAMAPGSGIADVRRLRSIMRRGGSLFALTDRARRGLDAWLRDAAQAFVHASVAVSDTDATGPVDDLAELGAPFAGDADAADSIDALPERLPGMEWGELVLFIACAGSFDAAAHANAS